MTDSVDRMSDEKKKKLLERVSQYPDKRIKDRTEPSDLPNWAKVALVKRELFGMTWADAAKEFNRAASTLNAYGKSPIGHKIRKQVSEFRDDPVEVSKALLASNALSVTLDRLVFLEWAKDVRDYATGDKIAADLQDRMGITKKSPKGSDTPTHLSITISGVGGTIEGEINVPVAEAEWEEVHEEDEDGKLLGDGS